MQVITVLVKLLNLLTCAIPLGHPWMKTLLDQDYLKSGNLTLTETVNIAHNHPLCMLLGMTGGKHSCDANQKAEIMMMMLQY